MKFQQVKSARDPQTVSNKLKRKLSRKSRGGEAWPEEFEEKSKTNKGNM